MKKYCNNCKYQEEDLYFSCLKVKGCKDTPKEPNSPILARPSEDNRDNNCPYYEEIKTTKMQKWARENKNKFSILVMILTILIFAIFSAIVYVVRLITQ